MQNEIHRMRSKADIYFLPEGAQRGYDEIPLHNELFNFTYTDTIDVMEVTSMGDYEPTMIPIIHKRHIELRTFGDFNRSLQGIRPGIRGTVTFLHANDPMAWHMDIVFSQVHTDFYSHEGWESLYRAEGISKLATGLYTCQRRVGRVQIDQGDGTFIEKELYYEVKLDEMLNNRYYKW